jgi:DNA-directed RNA polymerase subunit M/transcription elongation factor TFIIS
MSKTQNNSSTSTGSTDSSDEKAKHKTTIIPESTPSKQEQAQRRSIAKQRGDLDGVNFPDPAMFNGDSSTLFDEDGNYIPADQLARQTHKDPEAMTNEEILEFIAPHKLKRINEITDDGETKYYGATKAELLERHIREEMSIGMNENFEVIPKQVADPAAFEITHICQADNNRYTEGQKNEGWLPDVAKELASSECCPNCGSEETETVGMQTGSADEGQTVFIKCHDCDSMSKEGYGG